MEVLNQAFSDRVSTDGAIGIALVAALAASAAWAPPVVAMMAT
jgi:hypothetical protein